MNLVPVPAGIPSPQCYVSHVADMDNGQPVLCQTLFSVALNKKEVAIQRYRGVIHSLREFGCALSEHTLSEHRALR
jgi:hypothetical protein